MFRLILRTASANLRSRPVNSLLLALIVAGAATSLTLSVSLHSNASDPFNQIFRATNGADVHVYAFSGRDDLGKLSRLPGVREASGPYDLATVDVAGRPANARLSLVAMPARPQLERPRLTAGHWVGSAAGEVVLERSFARARGLRVGDGLRFAKPAGRPRLRVVGIAVSAAAGPYPDFEPAASWVTPATLAAVAPDASRHEQELHLKLDMPGSSGVVVNRIQRMYPPERVGVFDSSWVKSNVTSETNGLTIVLGSASLLALLAAGFVIANAISGRVLASRREIGLLKAAGFTPGGVTALFVVENVILALAASVVGTAVGIALSPLLLRRSAELLGTPTPSGFSVQAVAAGVLGVAAVVALFTAAPAWRAGRLKVLEAIRLGRTSVSARPSRVAVVAARLRLPVPVALGFKDAFAARSRALMTISSLSLTMFAVVAALGTEATYQRTINDSSLRAKPYDLLVGSDLSNARMEGLLNPHRAEIARTGTIAGFPVTADRGARFQARALGGDYRVRPYAVPDGRMVRGPGEAIVGRGLLERFRLRVGDRLHITAMGARLNLRIVGRYIEPDNDAVTAIFDEASLPPAQRARLRPDYALTIATVPAARRLQAELQRESGGAVRATVTEDDVKQERDDLRPIIWGMDALLLGIGLVNLLTTLLLGIRERRRDFAIYKTVGVTPRQVLAAVTSSGALLAVVAVAIGIPFGSVLFHSVVVATNPTDGPDLVTNPTWWWLLLLLPGMLVFTTIASLVPARQAAAVKPAEALRYE